MSSRFGPKHQCRVNDCYPQGNGEVGPVSGKISSLIYYINAKPNKLLKVSAYLEKKIIRDLYKEKPEHNCVTISIVEGIMQGCSDYFSTFAPTVLKILHMYSSEEFKISRTIDLASRIHKLFIEFCQMTKSVLSSIRDGEFFEILTEVLSRVLSLKHNGDQLSTQIQICLDLQAAVIMEDFRAPKGESRISIIIGRYVWEFYNLDASRIKPEYIFNRDRNRSITTSLEFQFLSGFVNLIESANSATIPVIVGCLFREFDSDSWLHQRLCANLLNVLVLTVQSQFLTIVLSEIFKRLERAEDVVVVILTETITNLLLSNRSPLGYSALELASNLLKLLRKQRPHASEEPRASFATARVPPPRTIFSICNTFVSLLKNANFALQKYEIIEHLIAKAFFPTDTNTSNSAAGVTNNILASVQTNSISRSGKGSLMPPERHCVGTVVLNSTEESHFQSVMWGILNALGDEISPPTVLRLKFIEVHIRLFELLFQMSLSSDLDFCLNSLVLWKRLVHNGLFISNNRKTFTNSKKLLLKSKSSPLSNTESSSDKSQNNCKVNIQVTLESNSLNNPSIYLLTKSRAVIAAICKKYDISILHYAAIFDLIMAIIYDCDIEQLSIFLNFISWLHESTLTVEKFTFEDHACVSMFTCVLLQDLGQVFCIKPLEELGLSALNSLNELGMATIRPGDILDKPRLSTFIKGYQEFNPADSVPKLDQIRKAFVDGLQESDVLIVAEKSFDTGYSFDMDADILKNLQPNINFGSIGFKKQNKTDFKICHPKSSSGIFSRLSRLGSASSSIFTAPAYYQSNSAILNIKLNNETFEGLNNSEYRTNAPSSLSNTLPVIPMESEALGILEYSASSQEASSVPSISSSGSYITTGVNSNCSNNVRPDLLDIQFDELSVKIRQQRKKQKENYISLLSQN